MEVPFWIMLFTTLLSTKISAETNSTNIDTKIATNVLEHRAKATIERIDLNKQVNNSFEIHRITQPVMETLSSSDQVNKKILLNSRNSSEKSDKLSDFKPSPQLETYFEYNRFPVIPALPEAKHFTQFNTNEKPIRSEVFSWTESPKLLTTHNQILYNKINFPTTQVPFLTSKNHPYPYFINNNYPEITTKSSYLNEPPSRDSYNTTTDIQYPYVITGTNHDTTSKNTNNGNLPNYSKQNGFLPGNFGNPSAISNNYGNLHSGISEKFGANIFDKPSVWNKGEYSGIGGLPLQKPNFEHTMSPSTELHQSPWKKIIKFLTAIIPIGLLLSALSPTIINVSPTNATQFRGRKENNMEYSYKQLLSSINYIHKLNSEGCEERVICEMLMGMVSSPNGERHVEHLLKSFTEQERNVLDKFHELQKIFEAINNGNCSTIGCDSIDKKNKSE